MAVPIKETKPGLPVTFQWTYRDFLRAFEQANGYLESGLIEGKFDPNYQWKLCAKSQTNANTGREFVSVHLYLVTKSRMLKFNELRWRGTLDKGLWVAARFQVSMLDVGGNIYRSAGGSMSEICIFQPDHGWGYNNFLPVENLRNFSQNLLPGGNLRLLCTVWIEESPRTESNKIGSGNFANDPGESTSYDKMADDFKKVLLSGIDSDFTIFVRDPNTSKITKYFVHKLILRARSPVFSAMFAGPHMENASNKIEITDFEDEIVYGMLEYMYTGKVQEKLITTQAADLLEIADKYLLEDLVNQCEIGVSRYLDVNNAMKILVFADSHSRPWLKTTTVKFISQHKQQVMKTPGFKKVSKECPTIIVDLYSFC